MTLHKSKGLEFDVVVRLDLRDWVLPNKKPGPNNNFDHPVYSDLVQDPNLHYVGVTRATKGCLLLTDTTRLNLEGKVKKATLSEFLTSNNVNELRRDS